MDKDQYHIITGGHRVSKSKRMCYSPSRKNIFYILHHLFNNSASFTKIVFFCTQVAICAKNAYANFDRVSRRLVSRSFILLLVFRTQRKFLASSAINVFWLGNFTITQMENTTHLEKLLNVFIFNFSVDTFVMPHEGHDVSSLII